MPRVSLPVTYNNVRPQEKSYFTFVAGLNTDASPLAFPDNFSSDEENFVLDIDGSRYRRLGLALEIGGADIEVTSAFTGVVRSHHWRNVGGNPTLNILVLQLGRYVMFFTDSDVISADNALGTLDLVNSKVSTATEEQVYSTYINTDYGRGHLFIVGPYIEPMYVEYDATLNEFTVHTLSIQERDFVGIDDGISNTAQPTTAVGSHTYNLQNAGWKTTLIDAFVADQSKYPSKNMIPWMGMARGTTSNVAEQDWTKAFSPDKLVAELFQDVPAPRGHYVRTIWNPAIVVGDGTSYNISTWSLSGVTAGAQTMHVVLDADHSLISGDEVVIEDHKAYYQITNPTGWDRGWFHLPWSADGYYDTITCNIRNVSAATAANPVVITTSADHGYSTGDRIKFLSMPGDFGTNLNGNTYTITVTATNQFSVSVNGVGWTAYTSGGTTTPRNFFDIPVTVPDMSDGWWNQFYSKGTAWVEYGESGLSAISKRPSCVAFYAGRVFYAGIQDSTMSSKIYYTQIVETESQYEKCYQQADPTSEFISDLVASDGGVISIPEMDNVKEIVPYNGRLLVFADNGVWEIGGGERGYFTAVGYSVRQITNAGCISGTSVIIADGTPYFWSDNIIYAIAQDPNLGFLLAQDISTGRIQKLLSSIPKEQKAIVQSAYDRNSQRIYWLYDTTAPVGEGGTVDGTFSNWLVFDLALKAYSKNVNRSTDFTIRTIYDIEKYKDTSADHRNIKFISDSTDRFTLRISELNDTSYEDYGTDASAFLETGNDGLGDVARRRHGKYLHTYMERTENIDAESTSECYVRYVWNWSDSTTSAAWANPYSIYKKLQRKYTHDTTGEPVVTARSKIRGSGRILRLRFDTEAGKNCHLYGWHLRNDINLEA